MLLRRPQRSSTTTVFVGWMPLIRLWCSTSTRNNITYIKPIVITAIVLIFASLAITFANGKCDVIFDLITLLEHIVHLFHFSCSFDQLYRTFCSNSDFSGCLRSNLLKKFIIFKGKKIPLQYFPLGTLFKTKSHYFKQCAK